ncbi:hypothetical protein GCM10027565_40410 [Bordetella tumulicola]
MIKGRARRRQPDIVRRALHERKTELLFQLAYGYAEGWLRYVAAPRRATKVQFFSESNKMPEMSEFYTCGHSRGVWVVP